MPRYSEIINTEATKAKMRRNHADVSGKNNPMHGIKLMGDKNPMFGRKRPDTSEFNTRTKKGKPLAPDHKLKVITVLNNIRSKNANKI